MGWQSGEEKSGSWKEDRQIIIQETMWLKKQRFSPRVDKRTSFIVNFCPSLPLRGLSHVVSEQQPGCE